MMQMRCPSCGKELEPNTEICTFCGASVSTREEPMVEPISPYDDLFSDDIIPPPKTPPKPKGPVLLPDEDEIPHVEIPEKKPGIPIPGRREWIFLAGLVGIAIILIAILMVAYTPSSNPQSVINTSYETPVTESVHEKEVTTSPTPIQTTPVKKEYSFFDNFNDKESGWGTFDTDTYLRYYSQGEYHIIQKGENLSSRALLGRDAANYFAEADTELKSGSLTSQYGLIFRFSDNDYYSFGINGRGWYTVQKHMNGRVYDLIPLTETYLLNKGYATNKLGINVEGNTLSIYINGKMVRAISDTSLTHGDVGFFVSKLAEGGFIKEQEVHVSFDNFTYKEHT